MSSAEQLSQLLGQQIPPGDYATEERLNAIIGIVTAMAKSYCRQTWAGGLPEDVEACVLTASARLIANPSQVSQRSEMGSFVTDLRGGFIGWSLIELAVLNRYRERAL